MSSTSIRKSLPLGIALAVLALLLPLAGLAQANHGTRTLDAEPETNSRPAGETQTITATISAAATQGSGAINIDFELEAGPNDEDGDTPTFPDRSCSIPAGSAQCSVSYVGEEPGTDTWRIWLDHDGENSTVEADPAEEQNANNPQDPDTFFPGIGDECTLVNGEPTPVEPDCTDVVEYTFQGIIHPAEIDCDDEQGPDTERAFNPSGGGNASNESVTCRVFDQNGNPITDADPTTSGRQTTTMYGENEGGANDPDDGASYDSPDYTCTTPSNSASNQCTMTVTQSELEEGNAEVCFWARGQNDASVGAAGQTHCVDEGEPTGENQEANGTDTPNDLADQIEVLWQERAATSLDVEAEAETLTRGGSRSLNATVYDQFGDQFQGDTTVYFEFFKRSPTDKTDHASDGNSPADPDRSCTTSNSPTCTVTYSQESRAGRDLICGWIGDTPTLSGTSKNASGTCNGEQRNDPDDADGDADEPQPTGDRIDVVETTWLNDPAATQLDCQPEFASAGLREAHTVTCTATTGEENTPVADTEIDFELTGVNDKDGPTLRTPDKSCLTNEEGECTVRVGSGSNRKEEGKTTYRAWIDSDYEDSTTEADKAEGRNEGKDPGDVAEPDNTDVVVRVRKSNS
jgi:hypothetical protein